LRADPRNAREHGADQLDRIAASIARYGFNAPILCSSDGMIIAGHARYAAALKLGLAEVPVVILEHLSDQQRRAYMLADNRLAELATWDHEKLATELGELSTAGVDVAELGWTADDLQQVLNRTAADLDAALDMPVTEMAAVVRRGDLWSLGEHHLICGDAANAADVDRLCAGAPIHLVNMDPPYNVNVTSRSNNAKEFDLALHPAKAKRTTHKLRPKDRPLLNDFMSEADFARMLRAWFGNAARMLLPGRGFYIWVPYWNGANYLSALAENGLYFSQSIIWVKEHPFLTRKDFMANHECVFYGWKEGAAHVFLGPTNAPDVWSVKKVNHTAMVHLTEKPVELAARAILYSSRKGENVLDLFGGSGSTLIACQATGRRAYLMELDPPYCDVILERWRRLTGIEPVIMTDGKSRPRARGKGRAP
jgi:DNA modification methylase